MKAKFLLTLLLLSFVSFSQGDPDDCVLKPNLLGIVKEDFIYCSYDLCSNEDGLFLIKGLNSQITSIKVAKGSQSQVRKVLGVQRQLGTIKKVFEKNSKVYIITYNKKEAFLLQYKIKENVLKLIVKIPVEGLKKFAEVTVQDLLDGQGIGIIFGTDWISSGKWNATLAAVSIKDKKVFYSKKIYLADYVISKGEYYTHEVLFLDKYTVVRKLRQNSFGMVDVMLRTELVSYEDGENVLKVFDHQNKRENDVHWDVIPYINFMGNVQYYKGYIKGKNFVLENYDNNDNLIRRDFSLELDNEMLSLGEKNVSLYSNVLNKDTTLNRTISIEFTAKISSKRWHTIQFAVSKENGVVNETIFQNDHIIVHNDLVFQKEKMIYIDYEDSKYCDFFDKNYQFEGVSRISGERLFNYSRGGHMYTIMLQQKIGAKFVHVVEWK